MMASFEERTRGNGSMDGWDELAGSGGYVIRDEGDIRKYYTQIPNMIIDMDLSLSAFKLYIYLKKVAGERGSCFQSTETLIKRCRLSENTIIKAKRELEGIGLITISKRKHPKNGYFYHIITIENIWKENVDLYLPSKSEVSSPQNVRTNNNPYNNNNTK